MKRIVALFSSCLTTKALPLWIFVGALLLTIPALYSGLMLDDYPHQLSGGMRQRVMIAIALSCRPRLLIADEPTTALDVTIQAQVMDLLLRLQREQGMGLLLITHDLAVVASMAQRVAVMYAGQVVETGATDALFEQPRHPYTQALLAALPEHNRGVHGERRRLSALPGIVPGRADRPTGCLLAPRCSHAQPRCRAERPELVHGVPMEVKSSGLSTICMPVSTLLVLKAR